MAEKLVFDTSLDGLFHRALSGRITPELRTELKGLGIDLGKKLPPAVSRETWYRALDLSARACFPSVDARAALRELGVQMMKGIEETFFGKTMAPVVRMLGPRRILERVPKNMKSANNFAEGSVIRLEEHAMQLDVNDVGDAPEVMQGSLEQIVRWAGAKTVDVTFTFEQPPAARFIVRWTE
ncbi:MAG: DUF2378 family protein [Myxococcaceae bacterium]|nr:DUF2378 family protein [Myxococcaceae bacterium]